MPAAGRMADRVGSQQMNLTAVRRHDPYVADIVDSATQVAVYEYSSEASEWVSPAPERGPVGGSGDGERPGVDLCRWKVQHGMS